MCGPAEGYNFPMWPWGLQYLRCPTSGMPYLQGSHSDANTALLNDFTCYLNIHFIFRISMSNNLIDICVRPYKKVPCCRSQKGRYRPKEEKKVKNVENDFLMEI